ncbi:MAG: AAA family ATPase [Rickettsiales bacterium]
MLEAFAAGGTNTKRFVIAAADDYAKPVNTGKQKADEAAARFGCRMILPQFTSPDEKHSDFNDLMLVEGEEEARRQLWAFPAKGLRAVSYDDFMAKKFPARKTLLSPFLPEKGLAMLYADKGLGKTYVALSAALCIATGGDMFGGKWKAAGQSKSCISTEKCLWIPSGNVCAGLARVLA